MSDVKVDPVTLAVLRCRPEQITNKIYAPLSRRAFTPPFLPRRMTPCHGLYDAVTGDTLVQATSGLPIFVSVAAFAMRVAARAVA
jgi:N-methylhydantoinase B